MKNLASAIMSVTLGIILLPAGAGLCHANAADPASSTADSPATNNTATVETPNAMGKLGARTLRPKADEALARVRSAAEAAIESTTERGFTATALKDVFEMEMPDALCFSVDDGLYHVILDEGYFEFRISDGEVVAASETAQQNQLQAYSSAAAAKEALAASPTTAPDAFVTRGLAAEGDGGHGYYARVETLAEGTPGIVAGEAAYALESAESAVSVYQLGYASGTSANDAIDTFHASCFHTLVFPEGEYQLTGEVWSCYDDRSYYGLDATLYTDGAITLGRNSAHKALWVIRGNFEWGKGTETYDVVNADGTTTTKRKDFFHTVRNVELAGLAFERRNGEGATSGYNRFVVVRQARNVTLNGCSIDAGEPISGDTTLLRGASILLYGDYDGVTIANCTLNSDSAVGIIDLCDHVDNLPASWQCDEDNPTGGRNVVVRGCDFTTHNFDEALPIFAGNEQGLTTGDGSEYSALTHCLVENVLVERNRYTMLEPETNKKRVVAITCGYQDSPVRNVRIENNTFDLHVNGYVIMFGYADECSFAHNDVTVHATSSTSKLVPVCRSSHSRTGPTTNVRIEHNTIKFPEENDTVARMVDSGFAEGALAFSHNDVTVAGTVERVFDSLATSTDNVFHLNAVKRLYDRVGEVARNTYDIATLTGLYESYGTNAEADLRIHDEQANIAELTSNLLTFNGTPSYNGHSLSFSNCIYGIGTATNKYRRIAGDASAIVDGLALTFTGCEIPWFDTAPYNTVTSDGDGKLALQISRDFTRDDVAAMRASGGLVAGDVVTTKAYYATETGEGVSAGAGVYDVKAPAEVVYRNASESADGGRYIALENGLIAELRLSGDSADTVDLHQYGARGDGATDDATRIQAALNSGAAMVHASAGTYLIGDSPDSPDCGIALPAGVALVGDGAENCLFVPGENFSRSAVFAVEGASGVSLSGFGISGTAMGENAVSPSASWHAIRLVDSEEVSIDGLGMRNAAGSGLLVSGCKKLSVAGLDLEGFGMGADGPYAGVVLEGDGEGATLAGRIAFAEAGNASAGIEMRGRAYDASGLSIEGAEGKTAVALADSASENILHTDADITVAGTGDFTNDIVVNRVFELSGGSDALRDAAQAARFHASYLVNWIGAEGELFNSMPACQDGFVRTLTVNVQEGAMRLESGGNSPRDSIAWDEARTVAKGAVLSCDLVCQEGAWRVQRLEIDEPPAPVTPGQEEGSEANETDGKPTTGGDAGKTGGKPDAGGETANPPTTNKATDGAKAANTLVAKGKTIKRKAKTLNKKTLKVTRSKAVKVSGACGKVTYKRVKIVAQKKLRAQAKKKIKIAKSSGKITLKKSLKKGTYKLKVKVTAAGDSHHEPKSKTVTVTIKIK